MKIYKMTATFGKLDHAVLELQPGLNVIHAPNEWGKSTWCAFLLAMLYGMDTRAKSTKTALADKERYAPWSGSPMEGRIDLNWNGQDITIERRTKGRIPLGEFRAYETVTGLDIPELTAANCGQMLLGVEQSVFRRAGFVRLTDMPVTQDENLRSRLNALVTTGDESGDAERLEGKLRELKNRCRYNRTGALPQAEAERAQVEARLQELEGLQVQSRKLKNRLGEVGGWLRQLENHQAALDYAAAEEDALRVAEAREAWTQAEADLTVKETACAKLPSKEEADRKVRELETFREQWNSACMDAELLPGQPEAPELPEPFCGMTVRQAKDMAGEDLRRHELLKQTRPYLPFFLMAGAFLILGLIALWGEYAAAALCGAVGALMLVLGLRKRSAWREEAAALEEKYGSGDRDTWLAELEEYELAKAAYDRALLEYREARGDLDIRLTFLQKQRESLCGAQSPDKVLSLWQQIAARWEDYYAACRETQRAQRHMKSLEAMAKSVKKPETEDFLNYSQADTQRLLSDTQAERQRLLDRIAQYKGRMEALGDAGELEKQLLALNERIGKLEAVYDSLNLALDTLTQAKKELQRRFAPRIAKRAQELLGRLTLGRYDRLAWGEDLALRAGTGEEDTLRDALWRSDGTVDQLYLALRLAVAEELTKAAPLVLDDALVRFDDDRLKAALGVLQEMAAQKQVILFTCQQREGKIVG